MSQDSAQVLKDFLSVPSVTGSEKSFADTLVAFMRREFEADVLELQPVSGGRQNVFLMRGNAKVTLTSHMDTVPTAVPVRITDEAVYGTGACDAKGQIVTQLLALKDAIGRGLKDYACFYVVGEEVDSAGAHAAMLDSRLTGTFVLNGEPTTNKFVRRSRGVVECALVASGRSQHSSILPLDSAIHKLVQDLEGLLKTEDPDVSFNVGDISGGVAPNVSAPHAVAHICIRTNKDSESVVSMVRGLLTHSELQVLHSIEPMDLFVPPAQAAQAIDVSFSSDCRFYAEKYENVMLFGPGDIRLAHTEDEHILISDIESARKTIADVLLSV